MRRPLPGVAIVFCLGILSAASFRTPFFILALAAFLFLVSSAVLIKRNAAFGVLLLGSVFFLGAAMLRNSQILPQYHIAKLIPYKAGSVSLLGVIANDPVYQDRNVSFILKAEQAGIGKSWQKTCGKVLVKVFKKERFSYGNRVLVRGNLYRPFSFSKGFDYRSYLKHQNIYCILSAGKESGMVKLMERNAANPFVSFSFTIKHRLRDVIVKHLSPFSAGIMNALILGDRQDLSAHLLDILMKLGTIHIIAISGFNVGIIAFILLLVLKIPRIPRKPRSLITIALLAMYCVLTGASPPVVRATVMATIFLCSYFFEREADMYTSLSIASLILLAANPWQLFEISFQLSFVSVISIAWLSPRIKSLFPERLDKTPWLRFLILTFSVSSAAWIGLVPLIARYFKIFSTVTVLANMIIVPYSAIITTTGFSFALIGMLFPSLAHLFAAPNELLIAILFQIHSLLIAVPGAYFQLPEIGLFYIVLYYAALALILNFPKSYTLFVLPETPDNGREKSQ